MVAIGRDPTRTSTPARSQGIGARGNAVRSTQRMLNARGANLREDGIYGPNTRAAVADFQRQNGLKVDGIAGPKTMAALRGQNVEGMRTASLRRGSAAPTATGHLQRALNARGYDVKVDGKFGPQTERAVRAFQRDNGLRQDGVFGPKTLAAMQGTRPAAAGGTTGTGAATGPAPTPQPGAPANKTARFEQVSKEGQRSQMMTGRITINGNTYDFRSGGGGRGNLPPGDYKVTPHLWSRNDRSMSVGGVGYSFALSDKYDPRVGGTRTLLRIHPDGAGPGTIGCIGIVGNAQVQRQFREDMRAELARNGGSFTLNVR